MFLLPAPALFLQEFIEKGTSWAHIDMAGPVWSAKASTATGYGVKTLVEYVRNTGGETN
jgi:leucyl aminopeptidase